MGVCRSGWNEQRRIIGGTIITRREATEICAYANVGRSNFIVVGRMDKILLCLSGSFRREQLWPIRYDRECGLEWTADCWNDNYNGAPSHGSVWQEGNCTFRVTARRLLVRACPYGCIRGPFRSASHVKKTCGVAVEAETISAFGLRGRWRWHQIPTADSTLPANRVNSG